MAQQLTESSAAREVSDVSPTISLEDQRRGFRWMVLSVMVAFVGDEVFAGNILMVLALHFNAGEGYIGLLWFLILGGSLGQVFVVRLAQRVSRKRLACMIYGAAIVISIPLLALDWVAEVRGAKAALIVLAVCTAVRQFVYMSASMSWMALLRQMTPADRRGRWLGWLRTAWQGVLVVTLIATGLYLGRHPEWPRLQMMLILGLVAQVLRTACLLAVPTVSGESATATTRWREMILAPIRDVRFRWFLLYSACYGLALGVGDSFRLVYLIRLGFGQNLALVCSSLTALGGVATLFLWGRWADRFGNHGVVSMTLVGLASCAVGWFFVGSHAVGLIFGMVLFFAGGAFSAGNGLAQTRHLWGALNPRHEASYVAVTFTILLLATGIGALLGGQILSLLQSAGLQIGGSAINSYQMIFLISAATFVLPWLLRGRIKEQTDFAARHVVGSILTPLGRRIGAVTPRFGGSDGRV